MEQTSAAATARSQLIAALAAALDGFAALAPGSRRASARPHVRIPRFSTAVHMFELLRSTLAPQSVSGRAFGMPFDELVAIWYRHRNCVVHGGGCFPDDASFCLRTDQKFDQCRRAHEEVVAKHGGRDQLTDTCLQALRQTALLLLQAECC
jgi:hypothetical protein